MIFIKNDARIPGQNTISINAELFDEANQNIQEFIKLIIKKINPKVTGKQLELMMKRIKLSDRNHILNPTLKGKDIYEPDSTEIKEILETPDITLRLHIPYGVPIQNFAQGAVTIVPETDTTQKTGGKLKRRSNKRSNRRSNKRSNRRSNKRSNRRSNKRSNRRSNKRSNRRSNRRSNKRSNKRSNRRSNKRSNRRSNKRSNRRYNKKRK